MAVLSRSYEPAQELFAQQQTQDGMPKRTADTRHRPGFLWSVENSSRQKGTRTFMQTTPLPLSLQWLPGCLNQGRQGQTVRQIVICRLLVNSGSFPPVQRDKQAALSYGQVGPVKRKDWLIRAPEQDRAECLG